MEEPIKTKWMSQSINDEILAKLSLKNRYSFLNNNLMALLSPEQFNFLKKVQRFCIRFEKKNNITHGPDEDIYDWIPAFGKEGFITRNDPFAMIDLNYEYSGSAADFMRNLAMEFFDPQFTILI